MYLGVTTQSDDFISAGSKAKDDVANILKTMNFSMVKYNNDTSKIHKALFSKTDWRNAIQSNSESGMVVLQHPLYSKVSTNSLLKVLGEKQLKLVIFIHDVESLRQESDFNWERSLFNQATLLIVHNGAMANWLRNNGVNTPMHNLEVFDYLTDNQMMTEYSTNPEMSVAFAGNLAKSSFIDKFEDVIVDLYGPNPASRYPENIHYHGIVKPEVLPNKLNSSFGLVWDGDSVLGGTGRFGEYTKYNNPHKTSLYLSAGLPVIVWNEAAISEFVLKNNVGITVSNLTEVREILSEMSADDYGIMKKNALEVGKKLRDGFYTKQAIQKVIDGD